jgi:MFS transporter, DHA1 family, multidrug resistance protein
MNAGYARKAIVLGLLSAVGPFAIDMYIPSLPTIARDLHASTAATQMTLMVFFIAFGVCQIAYGPVSDMVGRKPPLFVGLVIFIIGSIGCGVSPTIEWLIAFRFLQGIGASSVTVIPRAIVRDMHTGVEAARLMALIMLVFSVSPILAPLVGSTLILPFGWRAVFVALTIVACLGLILVRFFLAETRPPEQRLAFNFASLFGGFATLLRDRHFLGLALISGFGISGFFAFIATSSFVYIGHFALTPTQYSLAFSVNAIGFIGASQFAARLGIRFGMPRVVLTAASAFTFFALLLLVVTFAGSDNLVVLMCLLFPALASLGLVIPSTMVLALEAHGRIAGIAAALAGTMQMLCGGAVVAIVSLFFDGTPLMMVAAIAVCAVVTLTLSVLTLTGRSAQAA